MNKNIIRLNESQLSRIIREAVEETLINAPQYTDTGNHKYTISQRKDAIRGRFPKGMYVCIMDNYGGEPDIFLGDERDAHEAATCSSGHCEGPFYNRAEAEHALNRARRQYSY
jgi:hypothetical protein